MAERPTPHSIAICTLIALHSDPSSILKQKKHSDSKEVDNHLFQLIQHLVLTNAEGWASNSPLSPTAHRRDETIPLAALLDMIGGCSGYDHGSRINIQKGLGSKSRKVQQKPPYYHAAKVLLEDLIQSSMSIDSLMDLFTALRSTIDKGIVDADSAHGIYVRKRCLGWNQLSFESVGRLWEAFQLYVSASSNWGQQMTKKGPPSTSSRKYAKNKRKDANMRDMTNSYHEDYAMDTIHSFPNDEASCHATIQSEKENNIHYSSLWPMDPMQISRHLRNQCDALHQQNDDISHQSFASIEAQMQDILDTHPELTMAHFLRMLNCVRVGERVGALENFHRYFDYAMIQERKDRLLWGTATATTTPTAEGAQNNTDASPTPKIRRNVVQYSAIVLAAIYHSFCDDDLAKIATEEAVRVAQESGDGACLAYALGWLHATNGDGNNDNLIVGGDLLSHASTRAAEYNLRSLLAGTSLMQATHLASNMDTRDTNSTTVSDDTGFSPTSAWERIAAASAEGRTTAANTSSIIISTLPLHDTPTYMTNFNGSTEIMEIFAQQNLVSAELWKSMGNFNQSGFASQVAVQCYQDFLSRDQFAFAAQEIASSVLYGNASEKNVFGGQSTQKAQSLCLSLEQLAFNNLENDSSSIQSRVDDEESVLARTSNVVYKQALDKLRELKASRPNAVNSSWRHQESLIMHEWSIRRYDVDMTSSLNLRLHSFIPLTKKEGIKAYIETMGQQSLLQCRNRNWDEAKQIIQKRICPLCEKHQFHYLHAHYLLQIALIHLDCNRDQAINALPYILECLSLCETKSIDSIHASALVVLSRTQFELDNSRRARATLNGAMSTILQHSHLWFQGEAWLVMAKCTISDVKKVLDDDQTGSKLKSKQQALTRLKKALSHLRESSIAFEKIQDVLRLREVYYLQAQTFNQFESQRLNRNKAAKKFQEMNNKIVSGVLTPSWHDAIQYTDSRLFTQ